MRPASRKTRKVSSQADWTCPCHNVPVAKRMRHGTDPETGARKFLGGFFACPRYGECGYYVSMDGTCPTTAATLQRLAAHGR